MLSMLLRFMEKRGCTRMIHRTEKGQKPRRYLKRYYIFRSAWFGVFIHQFWSSDPDHYHDHPWSNVTLVLRGGYYESGPDGITKWRRVGFVRYRPAELFHRITVGPHAAGTPWSMFIHFKRKRDWGFLTHEGWFEAEQYGEKYESPVEKKGIDFKLVGHFFPRVVQLRPAVPCDCCD